MLINQSEAKHRTLSRAYRRGLTGRELKPDATLRDALRVRAILQRLGTVHVDNWRALCDSSGYNKSPDKPSPDCQGARFSLAFSFLSDTRKKGPSLLSAMFELARHRRSGAGVIFMLTP